MTTSNWICMEAGWWVLEIGQGRYKGAGGITLERGAWYVWPVDRNGPLSKHKTLKEAKAKLERHARRKKLWSRRG